MKNYAFRSTAAFVLCYFGLLLTGCSIHVDDKDKNNEKVDIKTPFANLNVNTDEKAADNGIPVYPGARPRPKSDGDSHRANVNIAGIGFGVKVIAAEYLSDDSPDKLKNFYEDKLKRWGDVVVCKGHNDHGSGYEHHGDNGKAKVNCSDSSGDGWEVKVGTNDNQHLVSIQPDGKGSRFGTVLIQIHGKDDKDNEL
jgi:hypothetical protein